MTFTHSPYLLSLFAPLSTTPPHAHRSTSSRACSFDIDRRTTSAGREVGRVSFARSPTPHPPAHHLTSACARPLSRQVFSTPPLARPPHPRASQHGAAQRKRCHCGCACVRAVRSSGLLFFLSANVGLESASARAPAPRSPLNSNRKPTHVYTLCAGASNGALAEGVQPVIRAARDRGSIYRLARRTTPAYGKYGTCHPRINNPSSSDGAPRASRLR